MYLESNPGMQNHYVKNFFEIEIKVDVLLLRMVLDVVSKCLKSVDVATDAFENSNFLSSSQRFNRESILEDIQEAENEPEDFNSTHGSLFRNRTSALMDSFDQSGYSSSRSNRALIGNADGGPLGRTSTSQKPAFGFQIDLNASSRHRQEAINRQLEEEEEEEFLKEDPNTWDVFADAHKFERRDKILEKRKKQRVDEELKQIRSHREMTDDNLEMIELKHQLEKMKAKLDSRDEIIEKKNQREQELGKEKTELEEVLALKDREIWNLNQGVYQLEVLKEKFDQKDVEIETMIMRMAQAAEENAQLKDEVRLYD